MEVLVNVEGGLSTRTSTFRVIVPTAGQAVFDVVIRDLLDLSALLRPQNRSRARRQIRRHIYLGYQVRQGKIVTDLWHGKDVLMAWFWGLRIKFLSCRMS